MVAPPGGGVAAEGAAGELRQGGRSWLDVENADLEDVARLGAADEDRAGADMDAEPLAGAASEERSVHRPGAAAVDILALPRPQEDVLGAGIARDHALVVVIGVMGEHLDGDQVAGVDLEPRRKRPAEVPPMNRLGSRREMMVACGALLAASARPAGGVPAPAALGVRLPTSTALRPFRRDVPHPRTWLLPARLLHPPRKQQSFHDFPAATPGEDEEFASRLRLGYATTRKSVWASVSGLLSSMAMSLALSPPCPSLSYQSSPDLVS